jgi:hypothetical protein
MNRNAAAIFRITLHGSYRTLIISQRPIIMSFVFLVAVILPNVARVIPKWRMRETVRHASAPTFLRKTNLCQTLHSDITATGSKPLKLNKNTSILVTGRGRPWSFEKSQIPHFLDSWLKDYVEVSSLTRRPRFNPEKFPAIHFY